MRLFAGMAAVLGVVMMEAPYAQGPGDPVEIARILAARYPAQPMMSYIPALSWSGQLRLFELTGETVWRDRALKDIEAFTSGRTPPIAEPYRLTSLAGAFAFLDAATIAGNSAAHRVGMNVAQHMANAEGTDVRFATGWTDDMFMVSSVWSRTGTATEQALLATVLTSYATTLQRPDGIFVHAADGPYAWGRGNGFALLGLAEALTYTPPGWSGRGRVLEIYRKHVSALTRLQNDDGSWRQVVDEPASYKELTVTAMTTAAIARGVRLGWIDRNTYEPVAARGWTAVAARVNVDGTVKDVCSGTGAQHSRDYYLNRPVVNGADDRGGAMALLAAIEMASLQR